MSSSLPCPDTPLSREFFIDPSVYEEELRRIFRRSWMPLVHVDTVPPGSLQAMDLAGELLLVVRDHAGIARCFYNVCRHRGAVLVPTGESRPLTGDCLTCPYHAWRYDAQGQLLRAPHLQHADRGSSRRDLVQLPSLAWNGYLMVRLDDELQDDIREFAAVEPLLAPWHMDQLRCAASIEYRVAANWKLLFQNYSECYHCPTVHPRLNRLSSYRSATNHLMEGPCLGGPMQLSDGVASMTTDGQALGPHLPGLNARQRREVCYYTLFPAMFISPHPDFVMVHRLFPTAVAETRVVCEFLVAAAGPSDVTRAVDFWDQVNREDWHVCERVQQGAQSRAFRELEYTPLEGTVAAFDRYYRSVMA